MANQVHTRSAKRARFATESAGRTTRRLPIVPFGIAALTLAIIASIALAMATDQRKVGVKAVQAPAVSDKAQPRANEPANATQGAGIVKAATTGHEPYPAIVAQDGVVRVPLDTLNDGKARYFTYMNGEQPIEFFIVQSQDGVARAAFNACDVCWAAKKGYTQQEGVMICNNCGRRFPTDQVNVAAGGCNPSPIERSIADDTLLINVADIVAGATYF